MYKLAVGMPVFERSWILPIWFASLEANLPIPKENITLCFAYSKGFDGTYEQLRHYGDTYGNLMIYEFDLPTYSHREDMTRFHVLADLRNGLLDMVKETSCDYFLSWDNDCLFYPNTIQPLFDTIKSADAVGALVDMGGNNDAMHFPSLMHFENGPGECAWRKPWSDYNDPKEPFKVDIIMAVKLMTKECYRNTRYRWDLVGEDIGWSRDCEEKGFTRYLEPSVQGYHIYDKVRALKVLNDNKELDFPEILDKLRYWYK